MADAELWVVALGTVEYREALALQHEVRAARQADAIPDTLLLLEHPSVYTRGRRSEPGELPLGEDWYRDRGLDIVDVDRGGKVTYHGPGQLVGYPVVRVGDVPAFVRTLEDAMIDALAQEGVSARSRPEGGRDFTGVWVQERKIGSIGLHVAHGVTTHGFAVNVRNDLEPFTWVVPCGLQLPMTSVVQERGADVDLACFRKRMAHALAGRMGRRQRLVSPARLRATVQGDGQRAGEPVPAP